MQIVTGRRGEPHVTSRQMQAVYRSFLGDFALLDIGEKLRAEAYSNDIVRVYDGVVSVQGIYAVIAYNQYDEVYIEPVSVGKKRIDTIVLHYTKDNTLDVEDMQLDVVQGEEYTDNPIAPVVPEGGDAWEGTTDIQVAIYDVEVTNFGLTVTPYARMLTVIPTLDSIAERIPETVVTGVKGDSEVLYRDGDVNITKANIGLGNVDNTADTDKPISTATQTALNLKADLTYVDAKISAAYHAGGSKTVAELTSALLIADNIGKVYNMSDSGVTTSDFVEGAGEPINEGDNVGICNVGTEESPVYKFDLLSGFVDLSAYATTSAVNTGLAGKVDKVTGKGLSTEDYTTTDKIKLAGISEGATQTIANPADTATETLSKVEIEGTVYDIPQGASGATELSELTDVNLTDVEDNDILQYDETANKWKNSNALQGAKTATGNPITVTDTAPVNAVNLSVDLEPVQDLHGYDHPWVGGAGKNKLPLTVEGIKSANTEGTWNGNVYTIYDVNYTLITDDDNNVIGIKVNGTSSAIGSFARLYFHQAEIHNEYSGKILSGCPANNSVCYIRVEQRYSPYTVYAEDSGVEANISSDIENNECRAFIAVFSGKTANNLLFYPMIRDANTDSSFAPYTNICPISGRSEVAIQRVGKNLIGLGTSLNGFAGNTTFTDSATTVGFYFETKKLPDIITINAINGNRAYYSYYNEIPANGVPFEEKDQTQQTLPRTITVNKNYKYIHIQLSYNETNVTNIQVEQGSTPTSYEPYAGKTYTIQFGETVYGGQLDVTRGKMVVTHGFDEFDGSNDEDWSLQSINRYGIANFGIAINNYQPSDKYFGANYAKTNRFNKQTTVIANTRTEGFLLNTEGTLYIRFDSAVISTVADFKTWLANNNIQLVYEFATPFTIDLTPQQIKMLENTNTVYTDYEGDTITIEYQPNNAIGEAVRAVEESYDPEFAVRPVLKKIAFSGTTDTDGSVTLINASDIPINHRIIPLQITDMTIGGSAGTYFVEYKPYNSGDAVKGYCYFYMSGSQMFPVGKAITGNFYYYELEV